MAAGPLFKEAMTECCCLQFNLTRGTDDKKEAYEQRPAQPTHAALLVNPDQRKLEQRQETPTAKGPEATPEGDLAILMMEEGGGAHRRPSSGMLAHKRRHRDLRPELSDSCALAAAGFIDDGSEEAESFLDARRGAKADLLRGHGRPGGGDDEGRDTS